MKNIDIHLLQRKKRNSNHMGDIYEYDDRTSNLVSRKRRDTPQKSFNDLIEDIVDNCIKFDTTKLFHQAVKKKDYKDYYELILNPIDLSSMKNKTKRCEYNNLQQLKDDMDLLVNNSKLYNGEEHEVTLQAVKVRNYALMKIEENKIKIIEIENKINPIDENEE
jgi:transcription initiation factor TFIID subunit 1